MSTWTAVVVRWILLEQREPELLEAFHIHGAAVEHFFTRFQPSLLSVSIFWGSTLSLGCMSTWTAEVARWILFEQREPELLEAFLIHGAAVEHFLTRFQP
jgi:hypothetical protein